MFNVNMKKYAIRVKFKDVEKFKELCNSIDVEEYQEYSYLDNDSSTLFVASMSRQDATLLKIKVNVEMAEMIV